MSDWLDASVKDMMSALPDEGGSGQLVITSKDKTLGIVVFAKGDDAQKVADLYSRWDDSEDKT